jgi:deoxycytidine triphosphate deaminase
MDLRKQAHARFKEVIRKAISTTPITAGVRRDIERDYLASLPDIPFDPERPRGVLLADEIEHFATKHKLIDPFQPEKTKLRAAGYELSVGNIYSKGGEICELLDEIGRDEIVVQPFEVVIIQTLERLNMPEFMIARWNVAVGQAYQGFLWVGAAQVDPGFKGYLCCPIYNLSDKPRTLKRGQSLAVIDFVSTTPPTKKSAVHRFEALSRKRIRSKIMTPNH